MNGAVIQERRRDWVKHVRALYSPMPPEGGGVREIWFPLQIRCYLGGGGFGPPEPKLSQILPWVQIRWEPEGGDPEPKVIGNFTRRANPVRPPRGRSRNQKCWKFSETYKSKVFAEGGGTSEPILWNVEIRNQNWSKGREVCQNRQNFSESYSAN